MRLGSSLNDPLIGVGNDYAELCDLGKYHSLSLTAVKNGRRGWRKKIINWWKIVMLIAIMVTFREQAINWALFIDDALIGLSFSLF